MLHRHKSVYDFILFFLISSDVYVYYVCYVYMSMSLHVVSYFIIVDGYGTVLFYCIIDDYGCVCIGDGGDDVYRMIIAVMVEDWTAELQGVLVREDEIVVEDKVVSGICHLLSL